jgi:hypothetical protein
MHPGGVGTIGVLMWPVEKQIAISDTKEASSACVSGLRVGDILLEVDRRPVDASMLKDVVEKMKGPLGSTLRVTVSRKRKGSLKEESPTLFETIAVDVVRDVPLSQPPVVQKPSTVSENQQEQLQQQNQLKDATANMPNTAPEGTKEISPGTLNAFQHALASLRTDIKTPQRQSSLRSNSTDMPADDQTPLQWRFRCLASQKIAGKYRRGDEVVSTVNREASLSTDTGSQIVRPGGQIKVGDIGVVVGEGFDRQHVLVRFQVGEIQLNGQTELRQCVYQDVLNIDRQLKKAEEIRQNRLEDSVKSRNREEQERRTQAISTPPAPHASHVFETDARKTSHHGVVYTPRSWSASDKAYI